MNLTHTMTKSQNALIVGLPSPLETPFLTDSDIVPDPLQERFIFWRDVFRAGQFDIGDGVAEVIRMNAERGMKITHKRIFQAVSSFCGKTPRTVRYYYETAVFYPNEIRQEYDVLPFAHFVEARMFGDQWRSYLETAKLYPHKSASFVRQLLVAPQIGQNLTLPVVAAAVDVSGFQWPPVGVGPLEPWPPVAAYAPPYSGESLMPSAAVYTGDKRCEVSQDYQRHEKLGKIDAMLTATKEIIPIIEDAEIDDYQRCALLSACNDILKYLPNIGGSLV